MQKYKKNSENKKFKTLIKLKHLLFHNQGREIMPLPFRFVETNNNQKL